MNASPWPGAQIPNIHDENFPVLWDVSHKPHYLEKSVHFLFFFFFSLYVFLRRILKHFQLTTKPDVVFKLILHHSSFKLDLCLFTAWTNSFFFFLKKNTSCMYSHLTDFLTWMTCFCGMSWKENMFLSTSRMTFFFLTVTVLHSL